MSRYIDIEPIIAWCNDPEVCEPYGVNPVELEQKLLNAPSIRTKQVKYYDDDEKVWKIGEVIVNTLHDITDSYKGSEYNGSIKD